MVAKIDNSKEGSDLRYAIVVTGAVCLGIGLAALLAWHRVRDQQPAGDRSAADVNGEADGPWITDQLASERRELDRTVWSDEVTAQKYEALFVRLWDDLRASSDKFSVMASFPFEKLLLSKREDWQAHELDIQSIRFSERHMELSPDEWRRWLESMKADGFRLIQSEWHHSQFVPHPTSPRSVVSVTLHVENESRQTNYCLSGDLLVHWEKDRIVPKTIETQDLRMLSRQGGPMFRKAMVLRDSSSQINFLSMLMTFDLNGDGLSEIVLPSFNAVYRNQGAWSFERDRLFTEEPDSEMSCGLLADLTGDGRVELLGAWSEGLKLLSLNDDGRFSTSTDNVVHLDEPLVDPMVITAGDIDADGDLDVWIGQYKSPYRSGQMPTPYYDANDGHPAFLLRNDGHGQLTDVTEQAGLAAYRRRRTYSAAFVDLDGDHDLDLAVASDFSGLDAYTNDGSGHFTPETDRLVDRRHAFGMALTFGDYDLNMQPDFLMIGMSSTTARRLDRLGLGRNDFPEHQQYRRPMGYGNRMYLAGASGFRQAPFNDQVARTGWSWGASSFDFDNDADRDIYVANGHMSGNTAKDYCTRFWCHDIYTAESVDNVGIEDFFATTMAEELIPISWNGFEHNVLLCNQQGKGYLSMGFLGGVASEFDSRNVTSDDLDGDGRMDLVVVARENRNAPFAVHVFRNDLTNESNWIGVRLDKAPCSGLGARVTVRTPSQSFTDVVVCGDSLKSQHAAVVHFGLGAIRTVDEISIQWPQAATLRIEKPAVNQYHEAVPIK